MSDKVPSRGNLIYLLEVLWDYAHKAETDSAKTKFIEQWADDFEERFDIKYPPPDLGINVEEEIKSTEHIGQ